MLSSLVRKTCVACNTALANCGARTCFLAAEEHLIANVQAALTAKTPVSASEARCCCNGVITSEIEASPARPTPGRLAQLARQLGSPAASSPWAAGMAAGMTAGMTAGMGTPHLADELADEPPPYEEVPVVSRASVADEIERIAQFLQASAA